MVGEWRIYTCNYNNNNELRVQPLFLENESTALLCPNKIIGHFDFTEYVLHSYGGKAKN